MKRIAVLITCYNRKEKTIACLKSLFEAQKFFDKNLEINVYLTDDASTDGTSEAVRNTFSQVNILKGTGSLFWAGGMRNSWNEALKHKYDGFLLLNDDTFLSNNVFEDISNTEEYSLKKYNRKGIYIGSTRDLDTGNLTYGGAILINKFLLKYKKILPSGKPQPCDLGNANIMYVPNEVVNEIGILHENYQHGVADYDYTLSANKKDIPVLITPNFCGLCENDNRNKYETFNNKPFKGRIKYLYAPTGLAFKDNLLFMKRNFYYRLPFVFITGWLKVIFPKIYALRFR